MSPRFVVLAGPTASGKTDLAVQAAERARVNCEIIVLDSRQMYRGLDKGTGKPDASQLERVPHHLLDCLELDAIPDAMDYRERVEAVANEILSRGAVPFLVGGAGFYLRALRLGFHDFSYDNAELAAVRERINGWDLERIREALLVVDPEAAARLHPNDRYRLGRALEICELTGRTASELEAEFEPRPVLGASFDQVLLQPTIEIIHSRVEDRTGMWLDGGWTAEVRALLEAGWPADSPGLQILGYRQIVAMLQGEIDRDACEHEIIVATRRYARAQRTWFRKEPMREHFAEPDEAAVVGLAARLDAAAP